MAVDAGPRLPDLLPLGVELVRQHVGVTALLAEVLGEGVTRPHPLELRDSSQLAPRHHVPGVLVAGHVGNRLAAAVQRLLHVGGLEVVLVMLREVLAPLFRVGRVVVDLDDPRERRERLLFAFEDVGQQHRDGEADEPRHDRDEQQALARGLTARRHGNSVALPIVPDRRVAVDTG